MALLEVNFRSDVLSMNMALSAILPERPCPLGDGRWPVLYLLHGYSGDHTAWRRRTSIERYVSDRDLAVVMPSAHNSFYANTRYGLPYWTYISEELPMMCERMFPIATKAESRFVAGLSMGGYGALKLGLLQPDRFAAAASLSGAVDVVALSTGEQYRENQSLFTNLFGPMESIQGTDDDLAGVAGRIASGNQRRPRLYMACGTEDFLYENNQGFLKRFQEPLDITFEEGPGAHTWDFWDAYIQRVLVWMGL